MSNRSFLLIVLSLCVLAGCRSEEPPAPPKPAVQAVVQPGAVPQPEPVAPLQSAPTPDDVGTQPAAPPTELLAANLSPQTPARPLVAIIIDDMGNNRPLGRQFLDLEPRLSFSFLPQAPFTAELAQQAFAAGRDILVHLPMEPKEKKWQLEPDTLLVTDNPDQIRDKIEGMLAATPHATGASNHMGSRFCEDGSRMRVVIETLKARSFFFVDSFTSPESQGLATARRLHLSSARRHLFLDNDQDTAAICRQLDLLAHLAHRQGQAIGIGHPHQAMLAALSQCGPEALQSVEMVGIHRLVQ
jgi:hypothetical protein